MSQPSEYPEQLDDQSMGSQSNGLPAVAPVVPSAIEEPGSSLVPQEVHPPQEALFGDTRIFIHAPQFHWHDYGPETMDVDRDARNQIMDLADLLHTFGRRTEAREMELWGRVQETLRTQEVHQLVSRVETSMQEASAQFAQTMYQYVEEEVAKLVEDLAALGTDLQDLQTHQVSGEQLQDLATGGQVQAVEDRVTHMETTHRQYVDQAVAAVRTKLQAEINGKTVMIKAEVQQQLNELKASIGDALKTMKGQVAEVQKSQDKMWGAISRMGEELRELAAREDSSDEEQEAGPEVSQEETAPTWIPCVAPEAPRTVTSPIPPFGIPPKAPAVSFGTLDDASVRDSVSSTVPKQTASPKQESWVPLEDLFAGKATVEEKGKFLDPMVGSPPPHVDFTASVSGEDVSLVDKPVDVATTSAGGSAPLTAAGGQVKIEAPPRYSGKRQPSVRVWLTQMERYMRLMRYSPSDWLDIVAMRVEGAASSWVNAVLQDVAAGRRAAFLTWRQFTQAMIHRFEPVTETEEARKQLRALRQTGRVSGYIQKFQELQYRLPNMTAEEAFHAFLSGLAPHLQEHVGAHVQGDLEAAMAMAQRLEVYRGAGDGAKAGGEKKGSGKFQKRNKKGAALAVQEKEAEEIVQVIHNQPKKGKGKGKGRPQQQQQKKKQFRGKCFNCGGDHLLRDCKEWKEMRQKFRSSGN